MAPETPFEFATAQVFNCYIASTVHVAHAHKHRGARRADDETAHAHMRAKVHQNMTECAAIIETHYLQGPWVLGNRYSMCDPYMRWSPAGLVMMVLMLHNFQKSLRIIRPCEPAHPCKDFLRLHA